MAKFHKNAFEPCQIKWGTIIEIDNAGSYLEFIYLLFHISIEEYWVISSAIFSRN